MAIVVVVLLVLLVVAGLPGPAVSVSVTAAVGRLINSDRSAMASQHLSINSSVLEAASRLTVFAPNNAAFSGLRRLSINRILYQCSPFPHPIASLPIGSKIPTLLGNHTLVITANANSDTSPALNGLKIDKDPVFDDGSLLILGVDDFFDVVRPDTCGFDGDNCSTNGAVDSHANSLDRGTSPAPSGLKIDQDPVFDNGSRVDDFFDVRRPDACVFDGDNFSINGAVDALGTKNDYRVAASFLLVQLPRKTAVTIFAPANLAPDKVKGYDSSILRFVVPCIYKWVDLLRMEDGFVFETLLDGSNITLRNFNGSVWIDGTRVRHPGLYESEGMVIHGLDGPPSAFRLADILVSGGVLVITVGYQVCFAAMFRVHCK